MKIKNLYTLWQNQTIKRKMKYARILFMTSCTLEASAFLLVIIGIIIFQEDVFWRLFTYAIGVMAIDMICLYIHSVLKEHIKEHLANMLLQQIEDMSLPQEETHCPFDRDIPSCDLASPFHGYHLTDEQARRTFLENFHSRYTDFPFDNDGDREDTLSTPST